MKTIAKQSQILDILDNIEITAKTCLGKRGRTVTLESIDIFMHVI